MNKAYFYLKGEELGEIIKKIRLSKEKEIILVFNEETKSLTNSDNLDILKDEIKRLDKKVYFSTDNENILRLLNIKGLDIFLTEFEEDKKPIVDIKPPYRRLKNLSQPTNLSKEEIYPTTEIHYSDSKKKNFISSLWLAFKIIFTFSFIFSLTFFIFIFVQSKSEITIETKKNNIPINEVITIDSNLDKPIDYDNKIIKGEQIKVSLVKTEIIKPTGKIFTEKPPLKVSFLNYLDYEIPLVAGTRVSYGSNVFRIQKRIVIPPKVDQNPGIINVEALPDIINDDNLSINQDTNLKIPALENKKFDSGYWADFIKVKAAENYNLSPIKMESGLVTSEDITNAKLNLEKSLKEALKTEISIKYPNSFYPSDPFLVKVNTMNISHKVGEKTDNLSITGEGILETIIVSKKDIEDLIKNSINKDILNNKDNLFVEKLNLQEPELIDFDLNKKMILSIKGEAILGPNLNEELIKKELVGKKLNEVKQYFAKIKGIDTIRIKIVPPWKNSMPTKLERININIK